MRADFSTARTARTATITIINMTTIIITIILTGKKGISVVSAIDPNRS
jgi:hypothetical protein